MGNVASSLGRIFVILGAVALVSFFSACSRHRPDEDRLLVRKEHIIEEATVIATEDLVLVETIRAGNTTVGYGQQNLANRAERARQVALAKEQLVEELAERLNEDVVIPAEGVAVTTGETAGVGYNATAGLSEYAQLVTAMYDWLGVKYVWGGTTKNGADCSGFVQKVYGSIGYALPRVSYDQSIYGTLVDRKNLMLGDLLFFDTRNPRDHEDIKTPTEEMQYATSVELGEAPNVVSHVGVYIGNGVMLHASSGDGYITFADLESNYYKTRFINARRILDNSHNK